jgi:hypothetical protein
MNRGLKSLMVLLERPLYPRANRKSIKGWDTNAKIGLAVAIFCIFICGGLRSAGATLETNIWAGGTGSWTNATKWSLGVVPNNKSSTNYVVLIDNGNPINSSVKLDPFTSIIIDQVALDAGDSLTLNSATLELTNSLTVNGTLILASSNNFSYLELYPRGGTLVGTGQVVMAGMAQFDDVYAANGPVTIGPGITIHGGGGTIEGGVGAILTNQGTISADTSGGTITVQNFVNQGRLSALNGAGLILNTFSNNATITAAGGTLTLGGNWSNGGVISGNVTVINLGGAFTTASLGGLVNPGGTNFLSGTLSNTNSTLTLNLTNGTWALSGGTIQGGTVVTTNGTPLIIPFFNQAFLFGVTLDSPLTVSDRSTLYVSNSLTLNSTITLVSSNNDTYLKFYPNGGTLGGTGQVVMGGFAPGGINDLVDAANGPVTIGPGITIHGGGGTIEGGAGAMLTNQGTISADVNGTSITVEFFVNQGRLSAINGAGLTMFGFSNNGTITAAGGGTTTAGLVLEGNWSNSGVISGNASDFNLLGTFTTASVGGVINPGGTNFLGGTLINTNSTLTLNPSNGTWVLSGITIEGGTVVTTDGIPLVIPDFNQAFLFGVTLDSPLTVSNGATLYVGSGLTLNSTITLASSNDHNASLVFYPNAGTLGGTGQVVMGGLAPQNDTVVDPYGAVTIGPGITIHGAGGTIEDTANSVLTNQGTISADTSGGTITLLYVRNQGQLNALNGGILSANNLTNFGTVSIGNASTLEFLGDYVQQSGGTVLNGGILTPASNNCVLINAGGLTGVGVVNAVVTNSGTILPGIAPGELFLTSNLVLTASSALDLELGGFGQGSQYSFFAVSNAVVAGGTLHLSFVNGFNFVSTVTNGTSFTVLTAGLPITGSFNNVGSGGTLTTTDGFGIFTVNYNTRNLVLSGLQIVDSIGDGIPNWWRAEYFHGNGATTNGSSCATCDADGTGQKNLFKYVAGLDPTNPASIFVLSIASVGGQPNQESLIYSPMASGRTYTVQFHANLVGGIYTNLTGFTGPQTNGTQVTVTDLSATQTSKFYRVHISLP